MLKRRLWSLALWLCATPAFAVTLSLPAGGLPSGSMGGRAVIAYAASANSWRTLRSFALSQGFNNSWSTLDERSGRAAVTPLIRRLTPRQLAEMDDTQLPAERRQELARVFQQAQLEAAPEAEAFALATLENLLEALAQGRLGVEDLKLAERDLLGFTAYGGRTIAAYHQTRALWEKQQDAQVLSPARKIADGLTHSRTPEELPAGMTSVPQTLRPSHPSTPEKDFKQIPSPPSPSASRFETHSRVSAVMGWVLIGLATVILIGLVPALLPLMGSFLVVGGSILLILSKFLKSPSLGTTASIEPVSAPRKGFFTSFRELYAAARRSLGFQEKFENAVGGADLKNFKTWLSGAARSALYWLPLGLGGLLAGSILAWPFKKLGWLSDAAGTGTLVIDSATSVSLSGFFFLSVAVEALTLGLVFNGLRRLARRLLSSTLAADSTAGALTLAASGVFLSLTGLPLGIIVSMLGFEAVMIYIYARSGSLAVPVLARAMMSLASVESARMALLLEFGPVAALAGLPAWAGLAVLGIAVGGLSLWVSKGGWGALKSLASRELARLKKVGSDFSKPDPQGHPHSFWPVLAVGAFWGLIAYAVNDMTYWAVQFISPQSEPAPEILKRLLSMPMDIIAFNFMIVVLLEEWVFRRGVFKPMVDRVRKWGWPQRWWFWPAAILSSVIFSLAHFIDFGGILAALGLASPTSAALAGTYAWSWAGFGARVSAGMILAFLYARSGLLLIPMAAHFVSNALESVGLRFGFPIFLLTAAALLASYIWSTRHKPRSE